jgi:hypothetical protein
MKKIIASLVAVLLFAGISQAQIAQKTPAKAKPLAVSSQTTVSKPLNHTSTVSVGKTQTTATPGSTKTAAVRRKHHHKAHKAVSTSKKAE